MGKIKDYEQLIEFAGDEVFLVETSNGTRKMSYEQLVELIKEKHDEYIGDDVGDTILSAIQEGKITLEDMGITLGNADTIGFNDDGVGLGSNNVQDAISTLNSNKASREEIELQKARIDEIAKLPEGSTTGDAELADIRVGANGQKYNSAGEAVREQFGELKESLGDIVTVGKNKFDIDNLVNQVYNSNGELSDNSNYVLTDYYDVSKKHGYYIASKYNGYFAQFNSNKKFIRKTDNILYSNNRKIEDDVSYIRVGIGKQIAELEDEALWIESVKITETPLYDTYGKNLNDDVRIPKDVSKLNKNQGVDNAEKYLKVDENGNIVPSVPPIDDRLYLGEKIKNGGTNDGDQTIAIGAGSCKDEKCGMIAIGVDAGGKTESTDDSDNGHYSIAIGHRALQKNVTGDHNTAIGWGAMVDNYSGNGNTALGEDALCHNKEGNANTCVGNRAYQMGTGNRNVVIGSLAMYTSTKVSEQPSGDENVSVGTNAGCPSGHGNYNTCIGHEAQTIENIDASIAIGYKAKARKAQQVVIGNSLKYKRTLETLLIGDIIIMGTDSIFRKLVFNSDGTITWEDVSADYTDYIN